MKREVQMKRCAILIVFVILFTCLNRSWAEDKIIAIVNQDAITSKDLSDFSNFMRMQFSQQLKGRELEAKIESVKVDLLNRLIDDRLILQEAKKSNIIVDESRVRARLEEAKKSYPTEIQFHEELMSQGLTQADIEKKIREQFMMFGIIEKEVRSKISIKPEEVTEFYEKNKKELNTGETRELEALSFENEDLARSVSYNLRSGAKLADLASRFPFTVNHLKVSQSDGLRKEISDVVNKLGINEVSSPVEIDGKYYIFRLINIVASKGLTLSEAQGRVQNMLFEEKMQDALTKWLEKLRRDSYVKIMQN